MTLFAQIVLFVAALVVLAEAHNKLEFCDPLRPGLSTRERVLESLKASAWLLLALGAGGAIASPVMRLLGSQANLLPGLLRLDTPTLDHVVTMVGLAVVIVRTRVKEG